jgi:hypothetical protein
MSEPQTTKDGSVENISLGDIVDGLKWLANKTRLPGQPEIKYTNDAAPAEGEAPSEHWDQLANALREASTHAQALVDDWDSQQEHVEHAIFAGDNAGRGNGFHEMQEGLGVLIQHMKNLQAQKDAEEAQKKQIEKEKAEWEKMSPEERKKRQDEETKKIRDFEKRFPL